MAFNLLNELKPIDENRYGNADLARSLAILGVVVYHLNSNYFAMGYFGVDMFFVLSGFLVAKQLQTMDASAFLSRRIQRILIPLFISVTVLAPIILLVIPRLDLASQITMPTVSALLGLSNIYFNAIKHDYFAANIGQPFLHLWSLGIELQYYAIAALLAPLAKSKPIRVTLFVLVLCALSYYLNTLDSQLSSEKFFLIHFRIWEFLLGSLAYKLSRTVPPLLPSMIAYASAFALLFIFANPKSMIPKNGATLIVPWLTTIMIIARPISLGIIFAGPSKRAFSLYLIHFPVFFLLSLSADSTLLHEFVFLILALCASEIFFRFVDKPIQINKTVLLFKPPIKLSYLFVLAAIFVLFLTNILKQTPPQELATVNDSKILVAGDSHLPHVTTFMDSTDIKYKSISTICIPIYGINYIYSATNFLEKNLKCSAQQKHLLDLVESVEVVILVGRWSLSTMGAEVKNVKNLWSRETWLVDDEVSPNQWDTHQSKIIFERKFSNFISLLEQKNKQIIIIGEVPPLGTSISGCEGTYLTSVGLCNVKTFSEKEIEERLSFTTEVFRKAANQSERIHFLNPVPYLCKNSSCSSNNPHIALYRDDNHIDTTTPSRRAEYLSRLSPLFSELLSLLNEGS